MLPNPPTEARSRIPAPGGVHLVAQGHQQEIEKLRTGGIARLDQQSKQQHPATTRPSLPLTIVTQRKKCRECCTTTNCIHAIREELKACQNA